MTTGHSLEHLVHGTGDLVAYLRNLPTDTWEFVGVPSEFTNWRAEQVAGHEGAVLLHQGHMRHPLSEFYVQGPDAFRLLNHLGANSFANFGPGMAKQYIVCNEDGYLIGDCILFYLEEGKFALLGAMVIASWVKYHAARGGYDVALSHQDMVETASGERKAQDYYQFQIQGPNAKALLARLNGGVFPDLKFFHLGSISIAGRPIRCLSHSMLGEPGLECWFPLEWREEVIAEIVAVGEEFGLKQVGTRTYPTQTLESGWMGMPLPAIYAGEAMRDYREYLSADSFEAWFSIGGSFVGQRIEDYYYTPYEMNYGNFVRFDHDFIGRAALEAMKDQPHGRKVTLEWHPDDVARILTSYAGGGEELPFKYFDMPWAPYAMVQCDRISRDGRTVGRSADVGYSHYARAVLSLAVIDPDIAIGEEVVVTWGEENGGTRKNSVEPHRQIDVRAIVRAAPYTSVARENYHSAGWRVQAA